MTLKELKAEEVELECKLSINRAAQKRMNLDAYMRRNNIMEFDKFILTEGNTQTKVIICSYQYHGNDVCHPNVVQLMKNGLPGKRVKTIYDISKLKKIIQ